MVCRAVVPRSFFIDGRGGPRLHPSDLVRLPELMRSSNLKMLKRDCVAYVLTPIDPDAEAGADATERSLQHERVQVELSSRTLDAASRLQHART